MSGIGIGVETDNGYPTVYTMKPKRDPIECEERFRVDVNYSPPSKQGIEALQRLTQQWTRCYVEGNRLQDVNGMLIVPTATAHALLRRELVNMWTEPNSFVQTTFIEINDNGREWLKECAPKPTKRLTKRQKQREVEHLLDVLATGRNDE
jgi:hypothetical protein